MLLQEENTRLRGDIALLEQNNSRAQEECKQWKVEAWILAAEQALRDPPDDLVSAAMTEALREPRCLREQAMLSAAKPRAPPRPRRALAPSALGRIPKPRARTR